MKIEATSHATKEQVIEIFIDSTQIDSDVDTIRIVVSGPSGRPRSIVMPNPYRY